MTAPLPFDAARLRRLVRLAGPTSHDVRGACGTMAVHLELLATAVGDLPEPQRRRVAGYVDVLQRETKALLAALDAFFALVAPVGKPDELDLAALVDETAQALRPLATQRRIALDFTRPSLPIPAIAVREHVRQDILDVLVPLLDQSPAQSRVSLSLTATAGGGTLTIARPDVDPLVVSLPRPADTEA